MPKTKKSCSGRKRRGSSYWTQRRSMKSNMVEHMKNVRMWLNTNSEDDLNKAGPSNASVQDDNDSASEKSNLSISSVHELKCSTHRESDFEFSSEFSFQNSNSDSYSESRHDNSESIEQDIRSSLSCWAVQNNITHVALRSLIKILQPSHPELPSDPRTLLATRRDKMSKSISGGEYNL